MSPSLNETPASACHPSSRPPPGGPGARVIAATTKLRRTWKLAEKVSSKIQSAGTVWLYILQLVSVDDNRYACLPDSFALLGITVTAGIIGIRLDWFFTFGLKPPIPS